MRTAKTLQEILEPDPDFCFGRSELCERLKAVPFREGAALLFGGLLTGKTTILRRIEKDLVTQITNNNRHVVIPVYLDLRSEAMLDPARLFQSLLQECFDACHKYCGSGLSGHSSGPPIEIKTLAENLDIIFKHYGDKYGDFRLIFLLDNCHKLGDFPKALANLAWLLWMAPHQWRGKLSIIFAGGSRMRKVVDDVTSTIGTRARVEIIETLSEKSVLEIAKAAGLVQLAGNFNQLQAVFRATGGHAGLTRLLLQRIAAEGTEDMMTPSSLISVIARFAEENENRFREIHRSLSADVDFAHGQLSSRKEISVRELPVTTDRMVLKELRFVGIAAGDNHQIRPTGEIYWKLYSTSNAGIDSEKLEPGNVRSKEAVENLFRKKGEVWEIKYAGKEAYLPTSRGLELIHKLMSSPNDYFRCESLLGVAGNCDPPQGERLPDDLHNDLSSEADLNAAKGEDSAAEISDDAINRSRQAIKTLEQEIAKGEKHLKDDRKELDPEDIEAITKRLNEKKEEKVGIEEYLAKFTFEGKSKKISDDGDKSRKSVGAAISRAVREIGKTLPALEKHFLGQKFKKGGRTGALETGYQCCYRPPNGVTWNT